MFEKVDLLSMRQPTVEQAAIDEMILGTVLGVWKLTR